MENIVQNVQNLSVNDQQPQSESINLQDSDSAVATNNIISSEDTDIINAVAFINSNEAEDQLKGIVCLRKLLSKEQSPPIAKIVDTNICPRAISLAHKCEDSFTFEVTWMLTNILSGSSTDTQYLISLDIISFLLTIFERDNLDIKEQVLWGLGNIAGDSYQLRDMLLMHKDFRKLVLFLNDCALDRTSFTKTASWAVSNFMRGKPSPKKEMTKDLPEFLKRILIEITETESVIDALWGLSYFSDVDPKSEIFDEEMIRLLISKLENSNHRIIVASLRIIGNLSANVENFHRVLVSNGFVQTLVFLMSHQRSGIRKEIYWIVSNLVSESSVMIEQLLEADVYRRVYQVLKEEKDKLAKKEAVWIVANTASTCTLDQARKLAEIGLISELIVVLEQTPELFNLISDGILHYLNQDRELLSRENRQRLRSLIIAPRNDEADLIIIQKLSDLLNDYNDIEANN